MLGTGLGKKVGVQFVKDAYNDFLGEGGVKKPAAKRSMTKEEQREQYRKKGIFVAADDREFEPTVFEELSVKARPAKFKNSAKPLKWKKPGVSRRKKNEASMTQGRKKKPQKEDKTATKKGKSGTEEKSKNKKETFSSEPKEKKQTSSEPAVKAVMGAAPPPAPEDQYEPVEQVKETDQILIVEPAETAQQQAQSPAVPSPKTPPYEYTFRAPAQTPTEEHKEKEEAFAKIDDEEFEKVLAQEKAKCAEGDKEAVAAARKILKVACREKAFEKALTREENEVLIRFFSGRIPYDEKVLRTLDKALDKTIDWMKEHNCTLDSEISALIERRDNLKRALFAEFLLNPQYVPKAWTKKYEELRQQSRLETTGINWARVLLCYPLQKCFGDGPEDKFGNFTRGKRNRFLAVLLGPSDSKTFAETQKEEVCRGTFFDPAVMMDKAGRQEDTKVSSMTTNAQKKP